ncbi:MAG: hypothetical protein GX556_16005 [Fibrobacter sp.]|nr:hypothetical protein [Fibrobacter sp.]
MIDKLNSIEFWMQRANALNVQNITLQNKIDDLKLEIKQLTVLAEAQECVINSMIQKKSEPEPAPEPETESGIETLARKLSEEGPGITFTARDLNREINLLLVDAGCTPPV